MSVPIRVTSTGNHSFFNGVTDWVYEEEVFSGPGALWWSPDATRIACLVTDDGGVRDFEYSVFNSGGSASNVQPYSDTMKIPYPKPGTPNPVVTVEVFDLARYQQMHPEPPSKEVIDAQFVGALEWDAMRDKEESNAELMVKETNRVYILLRNTTACLLMKFV